MPKHQIKSVLLVLTITLLVLPAVLTFNDLITKVVERWVLYNFLQQQLVPFQVKLVGLVVRPFGVAYIPLRDGMIANTIELRMTWNCLGWQSLLMFLVSLIVVLKGYTFTWMSKLEVIFLGMFGIFWMNIFRMSITVLLAVYAMPVFRVVYHDIFAAVMTIVYLIGFWWFSYTFILEEKLANVKENH